MPLTMWWTKRFSDLARDMQALELRFGNKALEEATLLIQTSDLTCKQCIEMVKEKFDRNLTTVD